MKRRTLLLLLSLSLSFFSLLFISGCQKEDYFAYLSDLRSDLFAAETENYTLSISCNERERPYALDGIPSPRLKTIEIVLTEKEPSNEEGYEVYLLEDVPKGGEMSFRSVSGDWFYSRGVEEFPSGSVSVRVVFQNKSEDLTATSVKNEKTISPQDALKAAVSSEGEFIEQLKAEGRFCGEFHVRLLKRDKTYYYVAIVGKEKSVCLLLNSETGEVLARREKN